MSSRRHLVSPALALASLICSAFTPGCSSSGGGDANDGGSAFPFAVSNVDTTKLVTAGVGDIDITGAPCAISSEMLDTRCFDTSLVTYSVVTQPNNVKIGVYVAHSWRIEPNAVVNVFGAFPIVLVATDKIEILGTLAAAATGDNPVGGGYDGKVEAAARGAGPGGAGGGNMDSAAGGGSYCGAGGAGGAATGPGGAGGATYGNAQIVPLVGASTGGGGSRGGGAGGGAIQLVAKNQISIPSGGVVNVAGGGGDLTGGGGGAGGAILLQAPSVDIGGKLAANGGGGASGSPGLNGTPDAQPAGGGVASDSHAAGGNGSAGATVTGASGGAGSSTPLAWGGGGGGGAGWIRIETTSGAATITGLLSPDTTTSCATQGTLH